MAIAKTTLWKSKPLGSWAKMKEVRRNIMRQLWETKKRGDILYQGGYGSLTSLPAGLGNCGAFGWGPQMGAIMRDRNLAVQCNEAAENMGLGPDTCVTLRVNYGSALLGFHNKARSGECLQPDFAWEVHHCEAQAKTAQYFSEFYKIPLFSLDMPVVPTTHDQESAINYLIVQMNDFIEWVQKTTGREYKDELFVAAVDREWQSSVQWSRICEMQKAVPAPLDYRLLNSLAALLITSKWRPGIPELMKEIAAEVEDRVKQQIAAMPDERCRLTHEGQPPYYYPPLLKIPRDFGATFIGGRMIFALHGAWQTTDDGIWQAAKTPQERGVKIKDRATALRALAELYQTYGQSRNLALLQFYKAEDTLNVIRQWKADGVVFHLDRGCKGGAAGYMVSRSVAQKAGIPTMVYEASNADPRDLTESQVIDRMEAFLESLGLSRLETDRKEEPDDREE